MKILPLSFTKVLYAILIATLLVTVPGAIHRFLQTGDPYLFTEVFFQDMFARLSGPGKMRFIFQPVMALVLGIRDGTKDARIDAPPFLPALLFQCGPRSDLLRSALMTLRNLVAIAILLDVVAQLLIFRSVHPGAALLLGPVLIGLPYSITRTIANPLTRSFARSHP